MTPQIAQPSMVERVGRAIVGQWPWLLTWTLTVYAALPWLGAWLRERGYERPGLTIFRIYSAFCHQLPERSFFVGSQQVCYCHRCTSLYSGLALMSAVYAVGRWQNAISTRLLLLSTLPIVIDGVWHMFNDALPTLGLRAAESGVGSLNFSLRMITGLLCAVGAVLWAYPRINHELRDL
jgi:uncharacterized membrane protein